MKRKYISTNDMANIAKTSSEALSGKSGYMSEFSMQFPAVGLDTGYITVSCNSIGVKFKLDDKVISKKKLEEYLAKKFQELNS